MVVWRGNMSAFVSCVGERWRGQTVEEEEPFVGANVNVSGLVDGHGGGELSPGGYWGWYCCGGEP